MMNRQNQRNVRDHRWHDRQQNQVESRHRIRNRLDSLIEESQARQAVLDRVPGAQADDIRIRLKEDDGRMEYEGSLFYDGMFYEFTIDAYSGGLIEWEAEKASR